MNANSPTLDQIWNWLEEVVDPEIPVVSVVDLGIVRDLSWREDQGKPKLIVAITPTYSGCPATAVIKKDIVTTLGEHGITQVQIETRLAPAWTTDWLSEKGKRCLREYGIAPPQPVGMCSRASVQGQPIGTAAGPEGPPYHVLAGPDGPPYHAIECPRC
ncbi:MAG TPA: 1,2-phenylacetyl-CoA epoxidase subunit PaaD, partial [Chthoniobacterales bacterium]|nr:1,2-phenylacetyl-CoA epoxidase subunit PaaD [Chthoniobacterales bacterium]